MAAPQEQELNLIKGLLARFEHHPVVEVSKGPEVSQEVKSYIEKVETEAESSQPIVIGGNNVRIPPSQPKPRPSIILPLTPSQYAQGTKASVVDSIRWLAVWCLRLLKIYGPRATFRPEPNI